MADEIVQTPVATGAPETTTATDPSLWDIAKGIMGTGTAKGAALGALFTELLRQSSSGQGVAKPLDMSKYAIPGRETTVAGPRFVPYAEYGARDVGPVSAEAMRSFGAPTGLGSLMPTSQYTARPELASRAPITISSAGSGRNLMPTLNITPRSTQPISPLTGALLGGAMGYLMTPESAASRTGAQSLGNLYNLGANVLSKGAGYLADIFKSGSSGSVDPTKDPYVNVPGYDPNLNEPGTNIFGGGIGSNSWYPGGSNIDTSTSESSGGSSGYTEVPAFQVNPSTIDFSGISDWYSKDGGLATPLMANGGSVQEPSFYTYGTVVDPMQMMGSAQNMSHGGKPHGGLHVPTVEGRHDYRAGARVMGPGDGQSDDIPAMLADGEYVIDAETVAQLGNGSSKAGSDMLDKFREEIRAHKRSAPVNKIPPASKSPLQYLKQAQSRSKKNG
jgi:hypothetical protein